MPKKGRRTVKKLPEKEQPPPTLRDRVKAATGSSRVLTDKEATEMLDTLPAALEDDFRYTDEYLWSRQRAIAANPDDVDEMPVWSNVDNDEINALTRILISSGKRHPAAAAAARAIVDSRDYVVTAAIVGPRIKQTFDIVKATRKPMQKRGQRRENSNQ